MLKEIAGPTVSFHEDVSDKAFDELFAGAKAFLFAARDEEFGIAPVEAMGRGVPVIAYASGGLKETVLDGETGFLYDELSPESLSKAVQQFEALSATERDTMNQKARTHAQQYSFDRFAKQIRTYAGVTRG
jgi:glycosyltransferase involved in cell wall biosynthesis